MLHELLARLAAGEDPPADASVTVVPAPLGARALVVGGSAIAVIDSGGSAGVSATVNFAAPAGATTTSAGGVPGRGARTPRDFQVMLGSPMTRPPFIPLKRTRKKFSFCSTTSIRFAASFHSRLGGDAYGAG